MSKVSSSHSGYTIVETMIFLAVSAALFGSAMLFVNGQQRRTEFATAVRNLDSKIQSVMDNVSSGYYNNAGKVTCTVNAGPPRTPNPVFNASAVQGQSQDCTFVGQYLGLTAPDTFTITSYAGLRLNDAGQEVQSLTEARPAAITQTAETYKLTSGLTAKMRIVGSSDITTIGITSTFNTYSAGLLNSGSSRVELHALTSADPIYAGTINPTNGIQICIIGSGQRGLIFINTGSTNVTIENIAACPW